VTAARPEPGRLAQLDGLRGIAIVLVLVHHLWPLPAGSPPLGHWGVSLFFVLSGFLITRLLLDARRRIDAGTSHRREIGVFFARRAIRIFPPYYALLLIVWLLEVRRIDERFWWHATYLSNWMLANPVNWQQGGFDRHWWSLAVEEQFYLVWPWLILLVPRRAVAWVIAGAVLIGPAWRLVFTQAGWPWGWSNFPTPANADLLAMGGLVALLWRIEAVRRSSVLWWALVATGGAVTLLLELGGDGGLIWKAVAGPTGLALAFAGATALAARGLSGPVGTLLAGRPLVYLGTISYAMYLVHVFLGGLAWHWLGDGTDPHLVGLIAIAMTLAVGAISWHAFERPINRLKRFVPYTDPTCNLRVEVDSVLGGTTRQCRGDASTF
jgi:peptidoglycan/LPS O-acetylase OafA/YrhL